MRGIFFRHVLRDILLATLAVGLVLLAVLLTYQLAFVLGRAADGQVPGAVVLHLVMLSVRGNLNIILPFAVLLGTTLGLGRLYHDSEITAAQACGVGVHTLYGAAGAVTFAAALLAAWMAFVDGPAAARDVVKLRTEALRTAVTRGLYPGQFRSLGHGVTLYFRAQDADGALRDVFLERDVPPEAGRRARMQIVLAASARYAVSPDNNSYTIDLTDGRNYDGVPGEGAWRITQFRVQSIRVPTPQATLPGKPRVDVLDSAALLASTDRRLQGELHWRIAWVLDVIVLGMLAVPLARLRPRQGRHARVLWAVLLFAVYAGLLTAGRTMFERGAVPQVLGLWWVHVVAVLLGVAVLRLPVMRAAVWRRLQKG
ncbi:MAG: LPS export ABC transporter permease LptF [Steroidobacteraceae bacterium]